MKTAVMATILTAAAAGASAQTLSITRESCALLTRHTPGPDVEYRPGQDVVNGKKVVPADLNAAPPIVVPESFEIPITVDVIKFLGLTVTPELYRPEAVIGIVSYQDGRFYFNDQPLQDDAEATLAELCQRVRPR
jgi:hypothetical protein